MRNKTRLFSILLLLLAAVLLLSACAGNEQPDKAELTFYMGNATPVTFEVTDAKQVGALYALFTDAIQVSTLSDQKTFSGNQPAGGSGCNVRFYRQNNAAQRFGLHPHMDWWLTSTPPDAQDFKAETTFYYCQGKYHDGFRPTKEEVTELFLQLKDYAKQAGLTDWCYTYPWIIDSK